MESVCLRGEQVTLDMHDAEQVKKDRKRNRDEKVPSTDEELLPAATEHDESNVLSEDRDPRHS